jgi:hypothetical protein
MEGLADERGREHRGVCGTTGSIVVRWSKSVAPRLLELQLAAERRRKATKSRPSPNTAEETMLGFVFGALAGSIAVTYWSGGLSNLREQHMPRLRNQAADKVAVAERAIVGLVENISTQTRARLRCEEAATEQDAKRNASRGVIISGSEESIHLR